MYLDNLDELDQKIIQLLIENARISYSDIGEKTGISRVAVKARIQAMEKKGIIEESYTKMIQSHRFTVSQEETNCMYMLLLHQVMKWSTSCTTSLIHCPALSAVAAIQSYHGLKILKGYGCRGQIEVTHYGFF